MTKCHWSTGCNQKLAMQRALSFVDTLPDGFEYRDDVISEAEERELLERLGDVEFSAFEMRGVIARRRVAFFGHAYNEPERETPPIPPFLEPLRARLAEWARIAPGDFAMALVNEYRPGAPIGWHRDAPQYGIVGGASLGAFCRMKFRPYVSPRALQMSDDLPPRPHRRTTHEVTLAPRSAYLITGQARMSYEHSIPAVHALRYSITFRTLRSGRTT